MTTKSQIKLVVFDLNKTLIHDNSWQNLNLALGVTAAEDQEMMDAFYAGKLDFLDWIARLQGIYLSRGKDISFENLCNVLHKYTYLEGAKEIVSYLKQKGYEVAIISGAMDILIDHVAVELGIDPHLALANSAFIFDGSGKLKNIETIGTDYTAKVIMLNTLCTKLQITLKECACVGDGDNDIELFKETKHGITFPNSPILDSAWKVIHKLEDIKNIL